MPLGVRGNLEQPLVKIRSRVEQPVASQVVVRALRIGEHRRSETVERVHTGLEIGQLSLRLLAGARLLVVRSVNPVPEHVRVCVVALPVRRAFQRLLKRFPVSRLRDIQMFHHIPDAPGSGLTVEVQLSGREMGHFVTQPAFRHLEVRHHAIPLLLRHRRAGIEPGAGQHDRGNPREVFHEGTSSLARNRCAADAIWGETDYWIAEKPAGSAKTDSM